MRGRPAAAGLSAIRAAAAFGTALAGVLAGLGAAAPLAPARPPRAQQAQPQPIASEPFVSKISAYGGVLAWSHWDGAANVFRLSARYRGHTEVLPIAPRTVPFDVDLGPDANGRAVAVYSRCARERAPWVLGVASGRVVAPGGCVLYRYDFATRHERRVSHIVGAGSGSFYLPTIWKNEIAYVRARGAQGPALLVQPLSASRRQRIVALALPGGAAGAPGPVALDLRAGELAFAWHNKGSGQFDSGIYLDTFSTSGIVTSDVLDSETSDSRSPGLLGFPSLTSASLYYGRFDGSGIVPNNDAFEVITPPGASAALASAPRALRAQARDGNTTYAMYGPYAGTFSNCGFAGCTLMAYVGLPYR